MEVRQFDATVLKPVGPGGLILESAERSLSSPVFGGTLHLRQIANFASVEPLIHSEVQSVAIAGNSEETQKLATQLGRAGVNRFPTVGRMTNFENPWDGVDILHEMVRPVSLGGPA